MIRARTQVGFADGTTTTKHGTADLSESDDVASPFRLPESALVIVAVNAQRTGVDVARTQWRDVQSKAVSGLVLHTRYSSLDRVLPCLFTVAIDCRVSAETALSTDALSNSSVDFCELRKVMLSRGILIIPRSVTPASSKERTRHRSTQTVSVDTSFYVLHADRVATLTEQTFRFMMKMNQVAVADDDKMNSGKKLGRPRSNSSTSAQASSSSSAAARKRKIAQTMSLHEELSVWSLLTRHIKPVVSTATTTPPADCPSPGRAAEPGIPGHQGVTMPHQ